MFVETRDDIEVMVDGMIAAINERFHESSEEEKVEGLRMVLLGVSTIAMRNDVATDSYASLSTLFDYRSRVSDHFAAPDDIANLLTAEEVTLLPEADQKLAGWIATAIAV